ncbi:hypothetical protein [Pedobacter sp. NJ-S-72]
MFVSVFTVAVFIIPVVTSVLFNYPKKNVVELEVVEEAGEVLDKV